MGGIRPGSGWRGGPDAASPSDAARLMRIVMATEGPRIGAASLGGRPLGGVETAFALLAAAFVRRGHAVELRAGTEPAETRDGLRWVPLAPGGEPAELVLANRLPRLFRALPPPLPGRRRVLWLHNPGGYLRKPRHLLPLLAAWPRVVTLGASHSASLPAWLPLRPIEIPLAVAPPFDAPFLGGAFFEVGAAPQADVDTDARPDADAMAPGRGGAASGDAATPRHDAPAVPRGEETAAPRSDRPAASRSDGLAAPRSEGFSASPVDGLAAPRADGLAAPPSYRLATPPGDGLAAPPSDRLAAPRIDRLAAPRRDGLAAPRRAPPPVAVFTSNPLRGLDWLLDLWVARVRPAVPAAELHLYTGAATYGGDARLATRAAPVLARAAALATAGVRLFDPLPRPALAVRLSEARLMLYRGDPGETFCLALAEAQAIGLPCVVTALGAVAERIADGETGVVAGGDAAFAAAAIRLLSDDAAWSAMHRAALARGPGPSWDAVAARFEALAA